MKSIVNNAADLGFCGALFLGSVAVIHHNYIVEHGIHLYICGVCGLSLGFFYTVEFAKLNYTFFVY